MDGKLLMMQLGQQRKWRNDVFGLGGMELLIAGIVAVLLFGSSLPSVMKNLGRSLPAFKMGIKEVEKEIQETEKRRVKA